MFIDKDIILVCVHTQLGSYCTGHHSSNGYVSSGYNYKTCSVYFSEPFDIINEVGREIRNILSKYSWEDEREDDFSPTYLELPPSVFSLDISCEIVNLLSKQYDDSVIFAPADLKEAQQLFYLSGERIVYNPSANLLASISGNQIEKISLRLFSLIQKCESLGIQYNPLWLTFVTRHGYVDMSSFFENKILFSKNHVAQYKIGTCRPKPNRTWDDGKYFGGGYCDFKFFPSIEKCTGPQFDFLRELIAAWNNSDCKKISEFRNLIPHFWYTLFE